MRKIYDFKSHACSALQLIYAIEAERNDCTTDEVVQRGYGLEKQQKDFSVTIRAYARLCASTVRFTQLTEDGVNLHYMMSSLSSSLDFNVSTLMNKCKLKGKLTPFLYHQKIHNPH